MFFLILFATIDTRKVGLFLQERVGENAKVFKILKVRKFNVNGQCSGFGKFLRKHKLDELPQLINVLKGEMSFVGPRPDIPKFTDTLKGEDRIILSVKPGITGPATLKFFNEEDLLKNKLNPEKYNREDNRQKKNAINKEYIENYHIFKDLKYMIKTVINVF